MNRVYVGRHERPALWVTDRDTVRHTAAERVSRPRHTPRHAGGGAAKP